MKHDCAIDQLDGQKKWVMIVNHVGFPFTFDCASADDDLGMYTLQNMIMEIVKGKFSPDEFDPFRSLWSLEGSVNLCAIELLLKFKYSNYSKSSPIVHIPDSKTPTAQINNQLFTNCYQSAVNTCKSLKINYGVPHQASSASCI